LTSRLGDWSDRIAATVAFAPMPKKSVQPLKVATLNDASVVMGQTVYVPVYSHIYSPDRTQKMDLAATLSIRNTDLTNPIIITSSNYYNTEDEQVRHLHISDIKLYLSRRSSTSADGTLSIGKLCCTNGLEIVKSFGLLHRSNALSYLRK